MISTLLKAHDSCASLLSVQMASGFMALNLFLLDIMPLLSCYILAANGFLKPRFTEIVFFVPGSLKSQCGK